MLDYGAGGAQNDFAAMPRVVQGKHRFKDPYGTNVEEYYPQNIMYDKRVHRGNSYAAMVIPAGTSHDTMVMEKRQTQKAQSLRRRTFKSTAKTPERVIPVYPNRDIPSPEPVPGRQHLFIQTDEYIENLTDKPPTQEMGIATEFYLDRPPVPLFQPKMPAKENCKATQIFDGDAELFDFDAEVEPMLNVLCLKTLEQARMEVLEENELSIMKQQKKEYEEVRNAELIEAQRFEAAEARVQAEKERRQNQQKARKQQRKNAHQKHVARVVSKKYLIGLKDRAISTLAGMSMLHPKLECDLHQDVLPWLMSQKDAFTKDEEDAQRFAALAIDAGILTRQKIHAKTLKARADRIKAAANDEKMAGQRQKERRAERQLARETRAKEEAKAKMRDEIRRLLIDKGSVVQGIASSELLEIHGCYERGKQFMGALGGQLQQLYYVINAVIQLYPAETALQDYYAKVAEDPKQEAIKNARNPRELLLENFFVPFLLTSIKELKCEFLQFLITPEMDALLQTFKLPKNSQDGSLEFGRMSSEQYIAFRHAFVEERMYNETYRANKGHKAMDIILSVICMILCHRVPKGLVSFRTESLSQKIKMTHPPRGVEVANRTQIEKVPVSGEFPTGEKGVEIEKNTNERAVVRILVPKRTMTLSEYNAEQRQEEGETESPKKEGEEEKADKSGDVSANEAKDESKVEEAEKQSNQKRSQSRLSRVPSEKIIEQDQEDKALAIANRINLQTPYMVLVMNDYAARAHRADFVEVMRSKLFDWFQENPKAQKQIQDLADEEAAAVDKTFIEQKCDTYNLPCLEYNVHAPDHE